MKKSLSIKDVCDLWSGKFYFLNSANLEKGDTSCCAVCDQRDGRALESEAAGRLYYDCYLLEIAGMILRGLNNPEECKFSDLVDIKPGDGFVARDFLLVVARTGENKYQKILALEGLGCKSDILGPEEYMEMRQLAIKLGLSSRFNFVRGC
jgi:hypothetical protein